MRKQTLREYMGELDKSLVAVVDSIQEHFGEMQRVGGTRVYDIEGEGQKGAIYLRPNLSAFAFGWKQPDKVETIYYWDQFSFNNSPDYALDLPDIGGNMHNVMPAIIEALENHTLGKIEV